MHVVIAVAMYTASMGSIWIITDNGGVMRRELLHIYGPFSICSFGLFIVIGLFVFVKLIEKHPLFRRLGLEDKFLKVLVAGVLSALVGGRILSIISYPEAFESVWQMISPWEPGYSIMGTIMAVALVVPYYLKRLGVPILPFLDLVALYAPLLQSISRIGCFCAGCCHGASTVLPWGITYTDPQSSAPLHVRLHPSQLYSSVALFGVFLFLFFVVQRKVRRPGQLAAAYLMLVSLERFVVDFFRGDRVEVPGIAGGFFSIDQLVALLILVVSTIFFIGTLFFGTCKGAHQQ